MLASAADHAPRVPRAPAWSDETRLSSGPSGLARVRVCVGGCRGCRIPRVSLPPPDASPRLSLVLPLRFFQHQAISVASPWSEALLGTSRGLGEAFSTGRISPRPPAPDSPTAKSKARVRTRVYTGRTRDPGYIHPGTEGYMVMVMESPFGRGLSPDT